MILSFLFYAFLAYLLYRLVFNFIIPIYKTTKRVKKSFREMHQKMQEQTQGSNQQQQQTGNYANQHKKQPLGDYIDFEEVKD